MAFGSTTFTDAAGAVSDLFAAQGDRAKAQGDFSEASNYGLAANLAGENAEFTEASTKIKEAQQQRELTMAIGGQQAEVAGAGLASSGSAIDLMRDSASQGALTHAVLAQQGNITEAGYQEQEQSFKTMQQAAIAAGNAENEAATGADITGLLKGAAGIATLFTGGPAAAAAVTAGLDGLSAIH